MKNKIILVLITIQFFYLINLVSVQANEATASLKTSSEKVAEDEIQNFKEKIASKVAELTKKEQKAVSGFVIKVSEKQLTIKTEDSQDYQIKIDDILTKVYQIAGNQKKEIKIIQITKNDYVIVNGPISDNTISANYIFIDETYLINVGKVTEIDKENFSLKVATADKETVSLDIETSTKQLILDIKTLELVRSGFSKIKEGDTVHFIVKKKQSDKTETSFTAIKILIIPQEYFIK